MKNLWAWVDIETTGLDAGQDLILEVAIVLTDPQLNIVNQISQVIKQPRFTPVNLNDDVKTMHIKSGLISDCVKAKKTISEVEYDLRRFLLDVYFPEVESNVLERNQIPDLERPPMCGASIHFDRLFLQTDMKRLHGMFHYRNIDVSTYRRTFRDWFPDVSEYKQTKKHRALEDCLDSIEELKYYKSFIKL